MTSSFVHRGQHPPTHGRLERRGCSGPGPHPGPGTPASQGQAGEDSPGAWLRPSSALGSRRLQSCSVPGPRRPSGLGPAAFSPVHVPGAHVLPLGPAWSPSDPPCSPGLCVNTHHSFIHPSNAAGESAINSPVQTTGGRRVRRRRFGEQETGPEGWNDFPESPGSSGAAARSPPASPGPGAPSIQTGPARPCAPGGLPPSAPRT